MEKVNKIIYFILFLLLMVLLFQNFLLRRNTDKLIKDNNILPDDVKQEVVFKKDKVTIKEKVKDKKTGAVLVKTEIKYVPPEGQVSVVTKEDGESIVTVKNKGFTFTPGISVIPAKETNVGVSTRLIYYKRLGAGIGGVISIEDNPKVGAIGFIDYRFYSNFALGVAYRESFTNRGVGAMLTYYF